MASVGCTAFVFVGKLNHVDPFSGYEFHVLMNYCGIYTTGNVSLNRNTNIIPQN